jgi:hypothetical protein
MSGSNRTPDVQSQYGVHTYLSALSWLVPEVATAKPGTSSLEFSLPRMAGSGAPPGAGPTENSNLPDFVRTDPCPRPLSQKELSPTFHHSLTYGDARLKGGMLL